MVLIAPLVFLPSLGLYRNTCSGNRRYLDLVAAQKPLYTFATKKNKREFSNAIVRAVRFQIPSGRFLQRDLKTSIATWSDIGDTKARDKTRCVFWKISLSLSSNFNDTDSLYLVSFF